jgi:hypothetical protein
MITLKLSPDTRWDYVSNYLGFVKHGKDNSVGVGIHQDFQSTPATRRYMASLEPPNYPMPAIPHHSFVSNVFTITIWPGVIQYRISDEWLHGEYTGFGAVITIEYCNAGCYGVRYDDFN